jgi:hypothetical protein
MDMPVMDVGKVRVCVSDRRMLMTMRERLLTVPIKIIRMLMVLVVPVSMVMVQNLVSVRMFVALPDMLAVGAIAGETPQLGTTSESYDVDVD